MDNEFADLEAELLRLQPRQPGARLESRLAAELELTAALRPASSRARGVMEDRRATAPAPRYRTATAWTSWKWSNWAVAAALVAVMLTLQRVESRRSGVEDTAIAATTSATASVNPTTPADAAAAGLRPVKAGRVLLGSRVDGVVELADGSAVERVRDYFVDTIEWRDPAGNSQLRWEVPREAVRYVGLAAY
ncbi:hypothetical protein [Actomonas aquatica]|uniref:Uncharacterized protein n=1 Tax=Actomonas aquatica TaxID=2866162 RepID=A0ABZ1CDW8_9BACT|nr:hypothetical protein [Opitutus sp. WL0086]WRQ89878.1 hypothetical protein K1X11_010715 [Opitutus sp. WL0086]